MSSKFPSLEEIDDDLTTNTNNDGDFGDFTSNNDDFLAREKAALGEAASEFQTSEDKNVSSSQPDEIDGFNSSFPALESDNNKVRQTTKLFLHPGFLVFYQLIF